MNTLLKVGLTMLGSEFALAIIIGIVIAFAIVPWSISLIAAILFIIFNLISVIMILVGAISGEKNDSEIGFK